MHRLAELALRPVDAASLAVFRILFGATMCFGALRLIASGWLDTMYVEPRWAFKYPGFGWVEAWPAWGMYLHYAILSVLALMIALGLYHRIAIALFTIGFAYTQLIDVTNYLNHNYLVVLLGAQLALLPANAMWSLDAQRDPSLRRVAIPAWNVWLLRFQISVVYVFAGLAKLEGDWLLHGQPLNLWLTARTDTPVIGRWFDEPSVALAMSWAGFLFDTTIPLWLSWARTRIYAYIALVVFHSATGYLLNIGMFPFIMTTSALILFSPSWPRRLLGRTPPPLPVESFARPRKLVVYAIAAHVAIQVALPLLDSAADKLRPRERARAVQRAALLSIAAKIPALIAAWDRVRAGRRRDGGDRRMPGFSEPVPDEQVGSPVGGLAEPAVLEELQLREAQGLQFAHRLAGRLER